MAATTERQPQIYKLTVYYTGTAEEGFAQNVIDIRQDTGQFAYFTQIQNMSNSYDLEVRLNGSDKAVFTLQNNTTQVFNWGDLILDKLEFASVGDENSEVDVQVILGLR